MSIFSVRFENLKVLIFHSKNLYESEWSKTISKGWNPKYISGNHKINDKPDEMVKLQLSSDDILAPATFIVPKIIIRYHKL